MEKKGPFQVIEIRKPEIIGEYATVKKYAAMVTDAKDQAVYNAIIDAAKKAGINSLLLMDRRFVLNALEVAIKRQEMLDSCSEDPTIEAEPVRHAKVLYNVAIEKEECCGYKKRKGLVLQKYTCSSCYTAIPGESKFCMECGAKLNWGNEDGA